MASVGSTTAIKKVRLNSGDTRFEFQWTNWRAVQQADGSVKRVREQHTERRKTEAEAATLRKAITGAHSKGELFVPGSERPVARLRDAALAYAAAAANAQTRARRIVHVNRLLDVLGENALVSDLSSDALRAVASNATKAKLKTVARSVAEIELLWTWLATQDGYPGTPPLRKITGTEVHRPPPVFATAVATLEDCDAMIAHLDGWHARVGVILRYTGLRASQVLTLDRSDIDLDAGWIRLRPDARGAKGANYRVVPLHRGLIEDLRPWLPAAGPLFPPVPPMPGRRWVDPVTPTVKTLTKPFTQAWEAAKVAEAKWGAPENDLGGRKIGRPTHAFRGALESHMIRHGAGEVAKLVTGHGTSATHDAYIVAGDPMASPYWSKMKDALATVPAIDRGKLIAFGGARLPKP